METLDGLMAEARAVLRLQNPAVLDPDPACQLADRLAAYGLFGHAAAVIDATRRPDSPGFKHLSKKLALYTYKDTSLPVAERLATALSILQEIDLDSTTDQETLGQAAAIHKRLWEHTGKRSDLERCLEFYLRGCRQGIDSDNGYTAINAAFVLDLLAGESNQAALHDEVHELRRRARAIREQVVTALTARCNPEQVAREKDWWRAATVIEALLGLGDVERARPWLAAAGSMQAESWERESTLRQLHRLIRSCGLEPAPQDECHALLAEFFPAEYSAIRNGPPGRMGLALSGGGFRASLFHLGVLARLAEQDVLRHVEVISCVSGGSITGAHYYLALRNLLQTKDDAQIKPGEYVDLVRKMIETIRAGTRANIRMLALASIKANLRAVFDPRYARSNRIAELYDQYFFSRASDAHSSADDRMLPDLGIKLKGRAQEAFVASRDNWGRTNKVPALLLNATSLNTGHSWQFTPSAMGESNHRLDRIEASYQLRKVYFQDAPPALARQSLSRAVAASSCVPALFPPVSLLSIYPGKLVALVDGAIHDNQGVAGLLSEDCRVLLVSDAAGHIPAVDQPSMGYFGVLGRSIAILQTRLRIAQHRELAAMQRAGIIDLLFLHLKQGSVGKIVDWKGCDMRPLGYAAPSPASGAAPARGILPEIQGLLAVMRTDLDAFSDLEASALMYSGYQIAGEQLATLKWISPSQGVGAKSDWPFLNVARMMSGEDAPGSARLLKHLRASTRRGGKWLQLSHSARRLGILVVALLLAAAALMLWSGQRALLEHVAAWTLLGAAGLFVLLLAIAFTLQSWRRSRIAPETRPALSQILFDLIILLVGWIPAKIDVAIVRPAYLKLGRVEPPKGKDAR